tara:strand:- start:1 stop:582 length:582 start_codon:yes stop_codon:yes gene_type:complete
MISKQAGKTTPLLTYTFTINITMTKTFNPKIQNFIDQMVNHCGKKTATQCAIDAGFNNAGARSRASELMANTEVRDEIYRRLEEIREKWLITKDKHYQELGELRDMAKETKNVNAAVRAEELRGKVAGLYIDRQILASTKFVQLPDGSKKLEQDMTEEDYEKVLYALAEKHNALNPKTKSITASKNSRKKTKR